MTLVLLLSLMLGDLDWSLNLDSFGALEDRSGTVFERGTLLERARLNLDGDLGSGFSWRLAYELDGFVAKNVGALGVFNLGPALRYDDLNRVIADGQDGLLVQNLDRLSLAYDWGRTTLRIGRQAYGHGNGRFFTPSDIFAPLTATALNAQYKAGIDGVTLTGGFGDQGEWALLAFFTESGDGVTLAQVSGVIGNLDISVLVGESYGEPTLAWDLAGTVAGAAVHSEGIWREGEGRDNPLRLSLGINRRFGTKWDWTLEARHGNLDLDTPLRLISNPELMRGELFWIADTHLAVLASVELSPLQRLNLTAIYEAEHQGIWATAGWLWDVSDRAVFSLGLLLANADDLSEFASFSETLYAEYRLTLP